MRTRWHSFLSRVIYIACSFDNSTTTYDSRDRKQTSSPLRTCCNNSRLAIANCVTLIGAKLVQNFWLISHIQTVAKRNSADGHWLDSSSIFIVTITDFLLRKLLERVATFTLRRISRGHFVKAYRNTSQFFYKGAFHPLNIRKSTYKKKPHYSYSHLYYKYSEAD